MWISSRWKAIRRIESYWVEYERQGALPFLHRLIHFWRALFLHVGSMISIDIWYLWYLWRSWSWSLLHSVPLILLIGWFGWSRRGWLWRRFEPWQSTVKTKTLCGESRQGRQRRQYLAVSGRVKARLRSDTEWFYLVSNLNLVWGQSNFSESSLETMAVGAARSRLLRWSTSHTCTTTRSTSFWRASSRRQRLRFGIVSHRFDGIRTNRSFPKAHGSHSNASAYAIHTHSLVMSHDYLSPALCYWNIWNPQDSDSQDSPDSQQIFLCRTHAKQSGKRASPWINHVLSSPGRLTCTLTKRGA